MRVLAHDRDLNKRERETVIIIQFRKHIQRIDIIEKVLIDSLLSNHGYLIFLF